MHAVRFLAAGLAALTAATLSLAAAARPASQAASAAVSAAAAPAGGGCHEVFEPPHSWVVVCDNGGGSGGHGGSGGGGGKYTCSLQLLSPAQVKFLGLPKPPKGEKWAAITCPGRQPFGGVTLVSANGTPAVTPEELMEVARSELNIPVLRPATAPPLGKDGLVGLPEWYWIPGGWKPVNVTVSAGPVWATVTATPSQLTFDPGGGLADASCADGPGTAYNAASAQQAGCTYGYDQSSATQPGGTYAAAVTVTWVVTWKGSGGTGGLLNNGLQVSFPFALRVAEGQALVTRTGQ
jgi:hypothetical protein